MPSTTLDLLLVYAEAGISPLGQSMLLPPLGLVTMASFLQREGVRVRVLDTRHPMFSLPWFADYLAEMRPRWVGFNVMTDSLFTVARLAQFVRSHSPQSRIVCGGPHATIDGEGVFAAIDPDAIVRGDGEIPLRELMGAKNLAEVHGIVHRQGRGLSFTEPADLISLDDLPSPDFTLIEGMNELGYVPLAVMGRGCPYRCAFCAAPLLSPRVRYRRVDGVIRDIELARSTLGGSTVKMVDDTFTLDRVRLLDFCKRITAIGGGRDFSWFAEGRIDRLARHPEMLPAMRDAGLRSLQIGIESGDARVLTAYHKDIDLQETLDVIERCARLGIFTHTNIIFGGPFESEETIAANLAFAEQAVEKGRGFLHVNSVFLSPFPGTEIGLHPERFDLRIIDPELTRTANFENAVTESTHLSRREIIRHRSHFVLEMRRIQMQVVRAQDDAFQELCRSALAQMGAFHFALLAQCFPDMESIAPLVQQAYLDDAEARPAYRRVAGDAWRECIPVRTLMPFIREGDLLHPEGLSQPLSTIEGDVFDVAAGKITSLEIAARIGASPNAVRDALASLEEKNAIVYRTF